MTLGHVETKTDNIILSNKDLEEHFWVHNDVQFPNPLSPLFTSCIIPAITEGTAQAFDKLKMKVEKIEAKVFNGYYYQTTIPYKGDMEVREQEHQELMQQLIPQASERLEFYVENQLMPFYKRYKMIHHENLTKEKIINYLVEIEKFFITAWSIHYEVLVPKQAAGWMLEQSYGELTESIDTSEVYDLLTGTDNKSIETDRKIWELSKSVKESVLLNNLFSEYEKCELLNQLQQHPEGQEFLEELMKVLEVYGYRTGSSHEFINDTWFENPDYVLGIIKRYLSLDYDFDSHQKKLVLKREEKLAILLEGLPDSEEKEKFRTLFQHTLKCWSIEEDHHFYIDAMLPSVTRLALLEIGKWMVNEKLMESQQDIFYLYMKELKDSIANTEDVKAVIQLRKSQLQEYKAAPPIPFLGELTETVPTVDKELEQIFGFPQEPVNTVQKSFKGYAASKGTYKGTVRIIHSQAEFHRIKKGEVLVCKTITPPWTILFPIAGAIITDSGGILSHGAIVAREYAVPAVVGTKVATSVLLDGDTVVVDGTNGIIYFGQAYASRWSE